MVFCVRQPRFHHPHLIHFWWYYTFQWYYTFRLKWQLIQWDDERGGQCGLPRCRHGHLAKQQVAGVVLGCPLLSGRLQLVQGVNGGSCSPGVETGWVTGKPVTCCNTMSCAWQRESCAGLQGRESDQELCYPGPLSPHWVGVFLLEWRVREARQYFQA